MPYKKEEDMMTFKILSVLRPEVFKIENCEDNSINLLIDRKMAENSKGEENTILKEKIVLSALNQIVRIKKIKHLTNGVLAGNIYLKGKHLSFYYGSKKNITAGVF